MMIIFDSDKRKRKKLTAVRYVSCDLDGTLLHDDNSISGDTLEAVRQLRDAGVELIINSGRTNAFVQEKGALLGTLMPRVSLGGSLVRSSDGQTLYASIMRDEVIRMVCEIAGRSRDATVAAFTEMGIVHERTVVHLPRYLRSHPTESQKVKTLAEYFDKTILLVVAGPYAVVQEIVRSTARSFKDALFRGLYQSTSGVDRYYLEIKNNGDSKGSALSFLARHLREKAKSFAAIGDFDNDIEMCRFAGVSAALRNATDSLKQIVDFITVKTNNEDGAAEFLRLIIDARSSPRER